MNDTTREAKTICLICGKVTCICEKDIITTDDLREDPEEGDSGTTTDRHDPREDDRKTDLEIIEHHFK